MGFPTVVKKQRGFLRAALKQRSGGGTPEKKSQVTKKQEMNTRKTLNLSLSCFLALL